VRKGGFGGAAEAGLRPVGQLDHAGLAVDEDLILRHGAHLDCAAARWQRPRCRSASTSGGSSFQRALSALSLALWAARRSLLQTTCTVGMSAIASPTSSKIELRK
jgi:hypothetical protein